MTAIAQELDRKLQTLSPAQAARVERMVRELMASLEPASGKAGAGQYSTRTHESGLLPGIDPTKLGQTAEDL